MFNLCRSQLIGSGVVRSSLRSSRVVFRTFASATTSGPLRKTLLYDLHVNHGAKMVPYAGWSMPVQYGGEGVKDSHLWVRSKAGLFDVSHMRQHLFEGDGALAFLESITPSDLSALENFNSTLSTFLHDMTGGIVDDTIITRISQNTFYVVTNAGCEEKDFAFLKEKIDAFHKVNQEKVVHKVLDRGLLALQGPKAAEVLEDVLQIAPELKNYFTMDGHSRVDTPEMLKKLKFGQLTFLQNEHPHNLDNTIFIARGGYTGEDGFEISIPPALTEEVARSILDIGTEKRVHLAGLGARDSLRLEAGMCLYGHELDDTTTPVEAGLSWVIGARRRQLADFPGAKVILQQLAEKPARRRVGIMVEGPAPAREGTEILGVGSEVIGKVTSGVPSPSLGKNIAMGYVNKGWGKVGTKIGLNVRGKRREGTIAKMPFVKPNYYRG